ncbi:hypothetical protein HHI36_019194 [Cryptolaemus montrouzieri]|uniref:Ninjurin-1 n=1 Tax=Cryptolaemus montrouzieri TaxID=559131 RepID=A0ABD2P296_9CUCU
MADVQKEQKDTTIVVDHPEAVKGTVKTDDENDDPVLEEVMVGEDEADIVATRTSNSYAAKKTVAQGMMDIALITSNANQLRYLVEYAGETRTYYLNMILIIVSLMLQVAVGVSLLFKGRYQLKGDLKHKNVSKINSFSVIGVFLVTLINVFIASFTMSSKQEPVVAATN